MKKLAIVTTHPIQYYAPVFKMLAERGNVEIKVFYTWEKDAAGFDKGFGRKISWDIPLLEGYNYEFVSNGGNMGRSFWSVNNQGLIAEISRWNASAVLVIGWNYLSHLKVMRHFKGKVPVFFRGDSTLLDETRSVKTLLRRKFLKWIYSYVDVALYVGANNKKYFKKHGLKESQLWFAPHAIDIDRFSDPSYFELAIELRRQYGIPDNKTIFIYVGKLEAKKNPLLLVEAFKQMVNDKVHLIFVGNGELEQEVRFAASGFSNIQFIEFQNQSVIPAIYRCGDIFVLPSKGPGETWGLAVNEAMACSRAILVSNKVGCAVDLVRHGVNGFQFASGSATELSKYMAQLAADRNVVRRMQEQSLALVKEWSLLKQVAAIENATVNNLL